MPRSNSVVATVGVAGAATAFLIRMLILKKKSDTKISEDEVTCVQLAVNDEASAVDPLGPYASQGSTAENQHTEATSETTTGEIEEDFRIKAEKVIRVATYVPEEEVEAGSVGETTKEELPKRKSSLKAIKAKVAKGIKRTFSNTSSKVQ